MKAQFITAFAPMNYTIFLLEQNGIYYVVGYSEKRGIYSVCPCCMLNENRMEITEAILSFTPRIEGKVRWVSQPGEKYGSELNPINRPFLQQEMFCEGSVEEISTDGAKVLHEEFRRVTSG